MTTLLLIRHGESEANREGYFAGQSDAALLEKGLMQARLTAEFIKNEYDVAKIYASDLRRAYDTGKVLSELIGIKVIPEKRLREIFAGVWQGMKFDDIERQFESDYGVWRNDIGNCKTTCGESVRELGERVMAALLDIARDNDGKTVAVATHATPIRAVQCMIGDGFDSMKNIPWVTNASVTEIIYENGKWSLGRVCRDEHLSKFRTSFPANV